MERHGLIIIIALGESIVAVGVGASSSTQLQGNEIACALLGVVVAGALWWTYFDVTALVAERRLTSLHGAERARLARDSFSYLHFPMVLGIVLLALGIKKTLEHPDEVLKTIPAVAMCGGVGLFMLAHVARRLRAMHVRPPPLRGGGSVLRVDPRGAGGAGPRDARRAGGDRRRARRLRVLALPRGPRAPARGRALVSARRHT